MDFALNARLFKKKVRHKVTDGELRQHLMLFVKNTILHSGDNPAPRKAQSNFSRTPSERIGRLIQSVP